MTGPGVVVSGTTGATGRRGRRGVGGDRSDGRSRFRIADPALGEQHDASRDERETGGRDQPTRAPTVAELVDVEIERRSFRDTQRLRLGAKRGTEVVFEGPHRPISLDSAARARELNDLTVPARQSNATAISASLKSA